MSREEQVALIIAAVTVLALLVWLPWCVRREVRRDRVVIARDRAVRRSSSELLDCVHCGGHAGGCAAAVVGATGGVPTCCATCAASDGHLHTRAGYAEYVEAQALAAAPGVLVRFHAGGPMTEAEALAEITAEQFQRHFEKVADRPYDHEEDGL